MLSLSDEVAFDDIISNSGPMALIFVKGKLKNADWAFCISIKFISILVHD